MSYVEWLRVRNCLIGVGATMAVFFVIALVLRIVFASEIGSSDAFVNHISMEPGTKIAHSTLSDGTPRTTIVSPSEKTTITIDGGGTIFERRVTIVEPAGSHDHNNNVVFGSSSVHSNTKDGITTTTIETNSAAPIWIYFAFASVVALIVATILGAPFARENDGHLEIAAMRPQARVTLALRTIGVDLAGIVLTLLVAVVGLIFCQTLFEWPRFTTDSSTAPVLALSIVGPFAWYALIAAATSSMKRGYGVVVGFAWPVAILVAVFGAITWGDSILGQLMHNVFGTLSWIDPLKYAGTHLRPDENTGSLIPDPKIMFNIAMETILFLVYSALAIFQWQKVEA